MQRARRGNRPLIWDEWRGCRDGCADRRDEARSKKPNPVVGDTGLVGRGSGRHTPRATVNTPVRARGVSLGTAGGAGARFGATTARGGGARPPRAAGRGGGPAA